MNLWILSQNNNYLEKIDGLYMVHFDKNIWNIYTTGNCDKIGSYNSKERVIQIFTEIKNLLNDISDNKIVGCVYEMPKE